ncbi:Phenylalanine--tRNA ligase beta subunit [invertebrate metagenome]|uniref:Phenylalanine--tRNA ligase beta subunit n=1 Tax=invertebrate metagenome TaxID=1711999 RepID=A0A2H9TAE3_9ZZZZ
MKFSEQWLRQWVDIDAESSELVHRLTMAGLEVDTTEQVAPDFSGIVVGEIIACEKHPDADRLRVTKVSTGTETFQVVCGAPNARTGLKAPFAMLGAVLPDFKIKKAKLRGVESFGMLCGASEIGLPDEIDGLLELPNDAPVGEDIRSYMKLDDTIIDIDLTPNRGDCLSIAGLAREASAGFLTDVHSPDIESVPAVIDDTFPLNILAPKGCPRYVGRVIRGVDTRQQAPLWLRERLRRADIRSIDPVVDVTNYVMLELGQPMHGFDLNSLSGSIQVRMAEEDEKLVLLDDKEVTLTPDTLVIADERKALAIAGVMGGEHSGVSSETRDIFLESAFFNPVTIAGKARSYGLHTDASHRFERGVDWQLQRQAIERATGLIVSICGGEPGPVTETVSQLDLPTLNTVMLEASKVSSLLGVEIADNHIEALLTRLGLGMDKVDEHQWRVSVPSWRFDISLAEDLVEEVGRIYGYDNLPEMIPEVSLKMKQVDESHVPVSLLRKVLVSRGYQEAVAFSFIDAKLHKLFDPDHEAVVLANPIASDLAVMRTSLLSGLVKTVSYNRSRQQNRIRLFETGLTFVKHPETGNLTQASMLAGVITGDRYPEGWQSESEPVDFYDLKGDLESLMKVGGMPERFTFEPEIHPAMHPGQSAAIYCEGQRVGFMGGLHPSVAKTMGIDQPCFLFEIVLNSLNNGRVTRFEPLSKFPAVRRDLALVVKRDITASALCDCASQIDSEYLQEVKVFDVYEGKGVKGGCKSVALGLTLQHSSRTLKDEEVSQLVEKVVDRLKEEFNALLRT